jgi:hypothetical protein
MRPKGGIVTQQTVEPCRHEDVIARYDHHSCAACGAYLPDHTGRRGTAAEPGEWFPSRDAFEHFKRTGVRAWEARRQDNLIKEAVEALTEIAKGAGPFNRDPLIHAENTIEHMKETALECITKLTGEKQ